VRLISADGSQLGIVALEEALEKARNEGLDLVEVAPKANPPVCRVMDFGKVLYEEKRKERQAKKKQKKIVVKEVKFTPKIEEHDFKVKTNRIRKFLKEGNRVKVSIFFRGRQIQHPEAGYEVLENIIEAVSDIGKVDQKGKLQHRFLVCNLVPAHHKD